MVSFDVLDPGLLAVLTDNQQHKCTPKCLNSGAPQGAPVCFYDIWILKLRALDILIEGEDTLLDTQRQRRLPELHSGGCPYCP